MVGTDCCGGLRQQGPYILRDGAEASFPARAVAVLRRCRRPGARPPRVCTPKIDSCSHGRSAWATGHAGTVALAPAKLLRVPGQRARSLARVPLHVGPYVRGSQCEAGQGWCGWVYLFQSALASTDHRGAQRQRPTGLLLAYADGSPHYKRLV